jgi:hypothetical protein
LTSQQVKAIEDGIVQSYQHALRCAKALQQTYHNAPLSAPAPTGLTDGMAGIRTDLEEAIRAVQLIDDSGFRKDGEQMVETTAAHIKKEKEGLITTYYPPLYGVKFIEVFQHLLTVSTEYFSVGSIAADLSAGLARATPPDLASQKADLERMEKALAKAKRAKDSLETLFNKCSALKGTRASAAVACPAPPCKPGTFTSAALQVTAPSQPQGAQYYFTTPIPNWLYYDHRHGFTSGGCNHEQGKVLVNIELLDSGNQPVAWTLEYGPGISPGPGQPAVMVHSGNACPFVQGGQTFNGCRIDNPELAFPLPSEGYIGTFSGDASNDPDYAATIDVHPAAMVGSTDTLHVLVSWELSGT